MSDDNLVPDTDALSVTPDEEIRRLREALEAQTLLAEEHRDRYLRAAAEFDNARKRAAREREEYTRYANESLLRELLPLLDNFERALQSARNEPTAAAVTAGGGVIQRGVLRGVGEIGGAAFHPFGQPFHSERGPE